MTVKRFSPSGLIEGMPFHHVAVATGSKQVHIAGAVSVDTEGRLIGVGDLTAQVSQTLRNIGTALAGAGASFDDVVRFTFYLVDWSGDKHDAFLEGFASVAEELQIPQPMAPSTLIGVQALLFPGVLVEIEATAVID